MEVQLVEGHNNNKACKFTYLLKSYILNYFYFISGANLSCKSQKIYVYTCEQYTLEIFCENL